MTSRTDRTATARIAAARAANPDAVALAMLCALAVRVEPALLRRLRLLVAGADVTAETDLWSGALVSGASVTGLAVAPEVAGALRAELRAPRYAARRAAALAEVGAAHAAAHWSIRLEEQLYRLDATGGTPAESERLLYAALGELVDGRDTGVGAQVGVARWLLGALARLPGRAGGEAAAAAGLGAGLRLGAPVPDTPTPVGDAWLPWLVRRAELAPVPVLVDFGGGRLTVGGDGSGVVIDLPRTDPLVLDLDWHDGSSRTRRVRFTDQQRVVVEVAADEVTLTGLDGRRVTLSTASARPGAGLDFAAQRARVRPFVGDPVMADSRDRQLLGGDGLIVSGGAGVGKTALACALADRWEHGGGIVLQHFYGVDPAWDNPATVLASLEAQLRAATDMPAVVPGGTPGDRLIAALDQVKGTPRPPIVLLDAAAADIGADTGAVLGALADSVLLLLTARRGHWPATTGVRRLSPVWIDAPLPAVCTGLLDLWADAVRVAFGLGPGSGVAEASLRGTLVELTRSVPGRLADVLDWALDRPVGTATVARIPWLLTSREPQMWERAERFELFAVARPGFTVDDLRRLAPDAEQPRLVAALGAAVATGVVTADGPLDDPGTELTPDPRLAPALHKRSPRRLADGHRAHLRPLFVQRSWSFGQPRLDPAPPAVLTAGRYAVSHGMYHALAADAEDGTQRAQDLAGSAAFLHRRAVQDGVDAVLDDLRAAGSALLPTAGSVAALARRQPERFVELLAARAVTAFVVPSGVDEWIRPPLVEELPVPDVGTGSRWEFRTVAVVWPDRPEPLLVGSDGSVVAAFDTDRPGAAFTLPGPVVRATGGTALIAATDGITAQAIDPVGDRFSDTFSVPGMQVGSVTPAAPVTALLLLGEGDRLVVGTASGVVVLAASGLWPEQALTGHRGPITHLAEVDESPSGGLLLTAGADGTARCWDPTTARQVAAVHHRGPVTHLCPLPGGLVASADGTGRIVIWSPRTGEVLRLVGHDGPVTALAAIGGTLGSAGPAGRVDRWGPLASRRDAVLVDGGPPVLLMATQADIRPDRLVTWHADRRLVVRDASGQELGGVHPPGVADPVLALLLREDSTVAVVHGDGLVIVDPWRAPDVGPGRVAVSRSGVVASGTPKGRVRLLGQERRRDDLAIERSIPASVGFGFLEPDAALMLADAVGVDVLVASRSVGWRPPPGDSVVRVATDGAVGALTTASGGLWQVRRRGSKRPTLDVTFAGEGPVPTALAVADSWIVTGNAGGRLRLFGGGVDRSVAASEEPITAVTPGGRWIVAGTANGRVLRWDTGTGQVLPLGRHDGAVTSAVRLTVELAATAGADGAVRLWDLDGGVEWRVLPLAGPASDVVVAPDGSLLVRCRPDTVTRLQMQWRSGDGPDGELLVRATVTPDAAPDTAAVEVRAAFELLGAPPGLSIGPDLDPPVPFRTTPDGRLDPPVRLAPGDRLLVRPATSSASLHLAVRTPDRRAERALVFPLDRLDPPGTEPS